MILPRTKEARNAARMWRRCYEMAMICRDTGHTADARWWAARCRHWQWAYLDWLLAAY